MCGYGHFAAVAVTHFVFTLSTCGHDLVFVAPRHIELRLQRCVVSPSQGSDLWQWCCMFACHVCTALFIYGILFLCVCFCCRFYFVASFCGISQLTNFYGHCISSSLGSKKGDIQLYAVKMCEYTTIFFHF